jgi:hypothetical protein
MLALEEMDWLGIPGALIGRVGSANVYLGSSHDLLAVAWHYHWFAIPVAISALLVLGLIWYRGYLTVGFIRREGLDPTTLPLYGALVAQALAQVLDIEDRLLSRRHPVFRYPLEEPFELLAAMLLVSGLLLKYSREWRRAGCDGRGAVSGRAGSATALRAARSTSTTPASPDGPPLNKRSGGHHQERRPPTEL